MKREETAKLLAVATAVYPSVKIINGTLDAWHELLGDLDFNVAQAALKQVLQRQLYPTLPTIGAIRQAAADLIYGRSLTAGEAFQLAVEWATDRRTLDDNDPIKRAARAIGSWEIKMSENPTAVRAQFTKIYDELISRQNESNVLGIAPPPLKAIKGGQS